MSVSWSKLMGLWEMASLLQATALNVHLATWASLLGGSYQLSCGLWASCPFRAMSSCIILSQFHLKKREDTGGQIRVDLWKCSKRWCFRPSCLKNWSTVRCLQRVLRWSEFLSCHASNGKEAWHLKSATFCPRIKINANVFIFLI